MISFKLQSDSYKCEFFTKDIVLKMWTFQKLSEMRYKN